MRTRTKALSLRFVPRQIFRLGKSPVRAIGHTGELQR